MAMTNIQQELWAQTLKTLLEDKLIARQICDTNIVKGAGDTWHIITMGEVSSANYSDAVPITYAATDDANTSITNQVDEVVPLVIHDSVKKQTTINWVDSYITRGSYVLNKKIETGVLGLYGSAGNDFYESGTTPWQFTVTTCADVGPFFAKLNKLATELNWPNQGRYIVGPSGFQEACMTYLGNRATGVGDRVIVGGVEGLSIGGFTVFFSNNCTTGSSVTHGLAGVMGDGIALGIDIDPSQVEMMRAEGAYADLVRMRARAAYGVYRSSTLVDVNFNETVVALS